VEQIDDLFSKDAENSIYRIVQEAVNNIIKHSRADEATLSVSQSGGELHLKVTDNGQGFQTAQSKLPEQRQEGFGLIGMAERVRMLGGKYDILSRPGQGTMIAISIPVSEPLHV
jgi:signal transduction histidine kinase